MRCIICDYSQLTTSFFHQGLYEEREDKRELHQQTDGTVICTWCEDASIGLWDPDLDEPEEVLEDEEETP